MGKGYGQSRYLNRMIGLIQKDDPSITIVVLNGFGIIDAKLAVLAMALVNNTHVTSLHLDGNAISDHGAELLAYVLQTNRTIECLSANDNRIQSAGADALASTLYENKTLTTLRLANNSIGNDGARRLRRMLRHNATLREVVLDGNGIAQSSLDKFDDRCSFELRRQKSAGDATAATAAASELWSSTNSEAVQSRKEDGGEEELDSSGQGWGASSQSSLFDASFYMGNDGARRYVIGSFGDDEEGSAGGEEGPGCGEGPGLGLSWENLVSYMANIQDDIDRLEGGEARGGARSGKSDGDDLSAASEEPRRDSKPLEKHKRRWKMFKRRTGKVRAHEP